jgi:biopolymer transport protein ExbD
LKELHEYEADDAVLRSGADLKEYQYLLIRKAVGKSGYSVANSFNHSILKNRITMMSRKKSSAVRGLRVLYALPLVGICLAANAQTVIDYKGSENPQTKYYAQPTEVNLVVVEEAGNVEYFVNGEHVSLETIGEKVNAARGDDSLAYVSIIGNPTVKSGTIQEVKNELRKIKAQKIQYKCTPDVTVQRRLEPSGPEKDLAEFMKSSKVGDVQIRLNGQDRLLYIRGKSNDDYITLYQEDLFALAKKDIEKDNGISFFFVIDDNSTYGAYSAAVQSVHDAFVAVREELAMETYGRPYGKLEDEQQEALLQRCRVRIYETGK